MDIRSRIVFVDFRGGLEMKTKVYSILDAAEVSQLKRSLEGI